MAKATAKKALSLLTALLLAVGLLGISPAPAAHAQGSKYYVDAVSGNDTNKGGSPTSAWRSLGKVNTVTFEPGDQILFKAGQAWSGELHPLGSGTTVKPITIGKYGSGAKPRIDGQGGLRAVFLYNQEYWDIGDLEVTNDSEQAATAPRRGVEIMAADYEAGSVTDLVHVSVLHGIRVHDLYIHDVNGEDNYNSSGIHVHVSVVEPAPAHRVTIFDGLLIENNVIDNVGRSGIYTNSIWYSRPQMGGESEPQLPWTPLKHVVIRGNKLTNIAGDGITPHNTDGAIVEWNKLDGFHQRSAGYNAGMWTYNGDNTLYQYNEVSGGRTTRDGMAFDFDHSSKGNIYQYNYSHDNDGGTLLLCGDVSKPDGGVYDGIFRYNVSENDRRQTFTVCDGNNVYNMQIHNNVFYVGPGLDTQLLPSGGGAMVEARLSNNIFYNLGSGGYSGKRSFTYDHNLFYGQNLPSTSVIPDPYMIIADPLFRSPGSGTGVGAGLAGYLLQAGSPAIGTGTVMTNLAALSGNAINRGVDLHAPLPNLAKNAEVTWGDKTSKPNWMKWDLGKSAEISQVRLFNDFKNSKLQLSDDSSFSTGVTTIESTSRRLVSFAPVHARYVRLYSDLPLSATWNHSDRIQIYGIYPVDYVPMSRPDAHGFPPDWMFAEFNSNGLTVPQAPVNVDGNLEDWQDVPQYLMDVDRQGNPLQFKHSVAFAWNGTDKLYVKGTVNVPDNWRASLPANAPEWWTDDVFEIFMMPALPADEQENRAKALHYGFNSNVLFTEGLSANANVKSLPVTEGKWSFEMEIPLTQEYVQAITAKREMFIKIGVELNSAGEISLFGHTTGGFWAPDNYVKLLMNP